MPCPGTNVTAAGGTIPVRIRELRNRFWVEFDNGVAVEVRAVGGVYGGIGRVRRGRQELRSPKLPIMPLIAAPDGCEVCRLELADLDSAGDELTIKLRPYFKLGSRTEEHTPDGGHIWNVGQWEQEPTRDRSGWLWLRLREVNRLVGEHEYAGFSYGYKFRSRKHRPDCIHDRATWELGGRATGNTVIMPGCRQNPLRRIANKQDRFTTALSFPGGSKVQFLPLFTQLPGFTFQFDRGGVLATAFEKPFDCRSLVQKKAGSNHLVHWHQMRPPASSAGQCLDFPALEVTWADSPATRVADRISQYVTLRDYLHGRYQRAVGIQGDGAACVGELVAGASAGQAALERAIDQLVSAGCSEVLVRGILPEPTQKEGDADRRLRMVADMAHCRGLEVGLSLDASVLDASAGPGAREEGRGGVLTPLRRLKKQCALDAVHLLRAGADAARDEEAAQCAEGFEKHVALHRRLQQQGYRCRLGRGGAFGVSTQPVPYGFLRNNEPLYGNSVQPFPYEQVLARQDRPQEAYFRGYANRVCYSVTFDGEQQAAAGLQDWWCAQYAAVNNAYCAVKDHMDYARLLSGGRGVLWEDADEDVRVLWAYREFTWRVGERAKVYDVMAGQAAGVEAGALKAKANCVYLVQNALEP